MQTPHLPIQVNSAGPAPQAQRARNGNAEANGQFSQTLSREIEARKEPVTPPAQSRSPAPARPQAGSAPQQAQDRGADKPAAAAAKAAHEKAPGKPSDAGEGADAAALDDAPAASAAVAAAEVSSPVVDMLNLVASFNQPGAPVSTDGAAAAAADALTAIDASGAAAAAAAADALGAAGKRASLALPAGGAPAPAEDVLGAGQRARPELAADAAAPALQATGKNAGAGQTLAAAAPLADGEAAAQVRATPFANMMAKADGSVLDKMKTAPAAGQDGALVNERAAPQGAGEHILPGKPDAASALPEPIRAAADAVPGASLRAREAAAELSQVKDFQVNGPATGPLQQAVAQAAQSVNGLAPGDKIAARVGTPAWNQQVAQKIVWMVGGAEQSAALTLNPPDLGPLQVVLSVSNDMASVTFSSGQLEVRQALEDAMPKLREMMSENGIALGDANVNDGSADQQQGEEQQSRRGGGAQRADNGPSNGSAAEAEARNNARPARVGQPQGMVDTFA